MKEGTLYFSDMHFGVTPENYAFVQESFDGLPDFCEENGVVISKAVDLGDSVDRWPMTGREFQDVHNNNLIIQGLRSIYQNIFGDRRVNVTVTPGNHDTVILDTKPAPETAFERSELAVTEMRAFLSRVFEDTPGAEIDVFRGVKETGEGVFSHHGDFLGGRPEESLLDTIAEITTDMTTEERISLINSNQEIYARMQGMWQNFRRFLWPALRLTKDCTDIRNRLFKFFIDRKEKDGVSIYDETITNFLLLDSLTEKPENSAIISGHWHVPNMVSDLSGFRGTVVNLGAWHDTHLPPAVAIRTNDRNRNLLWLVEYDYTAKKWRIKNEKSI